jgi:glutamine synthetase
MAEERGLAEARETLERAGATRIRVEIPDTDGNLRGKYAASSKVLKGKGATVSDVFYVLSIRDDVFEAPLTGVPTGFPDVVAKPDWTTLRPVPWDRDLYAVIADVQTKRGEPLGVDPRLALRKAEARAAEHGFEARFGIEYELYVFHCDEQGDRAVRDGRPRDLLPTGREWHAYSLWRMEDVREFMAEADALLRGYGVELEAWSTELGYGMIECATAPLPPLAAADAGARFKVAAKELAKRHGLLATFIAKWDMTQSGSPGHLHQSLLRDGRNVFWGGEMDTLSETGRHYLGGFISCARELSAFSSPNVNSYRRPSPELWAPTNASWGFDNRQAAVRAITLDEASARLEYRRPGADLNPYLAIAGCLDSGLHGIGNRIEPPPPSAGPAFDDPAAQAFPTTLEEAADALDGSNLARDWYGDELVTHYVVSRRAEAGYVRRIANQQVPDYELIRYLETA